MTRGLDLQGVGFKLEENAMKGIDQVLKSISFEE